MATNCYGTHVVQKALECEEDIKRIIVNELLENDPAFTLTSKHCRYALYKNGRTIELTFLSSHVWAKVMELSWHEGPPPPIFKVYVTSIRLFDIDLMRFQRQPIFARKMG
jgi:pumilio RNA-binding family